MIGFIVRHRSSGLGKIVRSGQGGIQVRFFQDGSEATFDKDAFDEGDLQRACLGLGTVCATTNGECTVNAISRRPTSAQPARYEVTYTAAGLRGEVPEVELTPLKEAAAKDPLGLLAALQAEGYPVFQAREALVDALARLTRQGSGLRALLSSRIDLRPHQAYVAGVVLLDRRRRYLLADEVGLGKTIEAGIVIHDLLSTKPDARALVLCPGALTQQWLCEMYAKFGGQVFTLLELHDQQAIDWKALRKVIAPLAGSAYRQAANFAGVPWDMVVVDEAHHLLASTVLYDFVQGLSRSSASLLLLSAIPASRREDEFLRLLALLEPDRYTPDVIKDTGRFQELYNEQRDIGRKLRLLRRRLDGIASGEFTAAEAAEHARDLPSLPALTEDSALRGMIASLDPQSAAFCQELQAVLHYVGDSYRINRRILRNRRQRLIEEEQLTRIERRPAFHPYEPDQLEHEVVQAALALLEAGKERNVSEELLLPFARVLLHSLVHPDAVHDVLSELAQAKAFQMNDKRRDFIALGHLAGYGDWGQYCRLLCGAIRRHLPEERIADALAAAQRWWQDESGFTRWNELVTFLAAAARARKASPPKLLLFAGFPGVALDLAERLRARFGPEAVTEFRSDLQREEKEANVRRFRGNRATWIMVSDETGGEGRNFQFAAELIHFDNPWYASRVEQRIGRLDRLGREKEDCTDVVSHVFFNEWAPEAGLVRCYAEGLQVYTQSMSGLEFALREVERTLVRLAIDEGSEGLAGYAPTVRGVAEEERARDDSDAVLDEASFEREAAERYRRISQSEAREKDVEEALTAYVKMVASDRSAKARSDDEYPEGVWALRPDAFPRGWLPEGVGEGLTEWKGTFRRRIAQERPDLHFFNVGHPLFDALVQSLTALTTGRTYAIDVKAHGRSPWMGFEFAFFPAPDLAALGNNLGLVNQARQLFEVTPLHLFCRYHEVGLEPDGSALRSLRESLDRRDKDRTWWNLTKMKAVHLQEQLLAQDWQQKVRAAYDLARAEAQRHFAEHLAGDLGAEQGRLQELERQVKREGGAQELAPIAALRQALLNWKVELDSAGFLSVNGNILGKR